MKDFYGRDINDGDVIVVNKHYEMEIGTLYKGKVRTLTTVDRAHISPNVYLLENPTQTEIAIKEAIVKKMQEKEEEKKKKAKEKRDKFTLLGGVFSNKQSSYIYLGHLHVIDKDINGNIIDESEGYYYAEIYGIGWRLKRGEKLEKIIDYMSKNYYKERYIHDYAQKSPKVSDGMIGIYDKYKNPKNIPNRVITDFNTWQQGKQPTVNFERTIEVLD